MGLSVTTYAISKGYTDETVEGGGAIKGKNCVINSITDIAATSSKPAGKRVNFGWTLDDGTTQSANMDVYNGKDGEGIDRMYVDENSHLIVVYDDGTEEDCGEITIPSSQADWAEDDPTSNAYISNKEMVYSAINTAVSAETSARQLVEGQLAAAISALNSDLSTEVSARQALSSSVDAAISALNADVSTQGSSISQLQTNLANKVDKVTGKGLSTNDYTDEDSTKLSGLANVKSIGTGLNLDSQGELTATGGGGTDDYTDLNNKPQINSVTLSGNKSLGDLGLGTAAIKDVPVSGDAGNSEVVLGNDSRLSDSRNAADVYEWAKASTKPTYTASEVGAVATSAVGVASGVAELDNTGKVPSSQLPSYVDDVVEGYYKAADGKFYEESTYETEIVGEAGKIYISVDTDIQYRWSGIAFAALGGALVLGETSSTAYRGDRGKTAYDFSQNPATEYPSMDGTAAVGVSGKWAREDHVHPSDTTKANKVSGATNGNLASLSADGNILDSGVKATDVYARDIYVATPAETKYYRIAYIDQSIRESKSKAYFITSKNAQDSILLTVAGNGEGFMNLVTVASAFGVQGANKIIDTLYYDGNNGYLYVKTTRAGGFNIEQISGIKSTLEITEDNEVNATANPVVAILPIPDDSNLVHLAGIETITGAKSFGNTSSGKTFMHESDAQEFHLTQPGLSSGTWAMFTPNFKADAQATTGYAYNGSSLHYITDANKKAFITVGQAISAGQTPVGGELYISKGNIATITDTNYKVELASKTETADATVKIDTDSKAVTFYGGVVASNITNSGAVSLYAEGNISIEADANGADISLTARDTVTVDASSVMVDADSAFGVVIDDKDFIAAHHATTDTIQVFSTEDQGSTRVDGDFMVRSDSRPSGGIDLYTYATSHNGGDINIKTVKSDAPASGVVTGDINIKSGSYITIESSDTTEIESGDELDITAHNGLYLQDAGNGSGFDMSGGEIDAHAEEFNIHKANNTGGNLNVDGNITSPTITAITDNLGSKNLLKVAAQTQTVNGVTFTVNRNAQGECTSISCSNTASSDIYFGLAENFSVESGYIISGCPSDGNGNYYLGSLGGSPELRDYGSGATASSNITYEYIAIYIKSGTNMNGKTFYPMIRPAGTSSTFVPYAPTNREIGSAMSIDTSRNATFAANIVAEGTVTANGSDYAENFPALENCPVCRFVTLDGEGIRLADGGDYILGVTSEAPSMIGDKDVDGVPVGLLGKLWVEHDGSARVNGFVVCGRDGIATASDAGYRVMAVNGGKCRILVK